MGFQFAGRQTQFYIDLVYGFAFSVGFLYLLLVGMDPRVAAFQGGLVLGYFLRVWENMTIYERILQEEVAQEVEEQVPEEVTAEVEEQVPEEVTAEVEERVPEELSALTEETMDDLTADVEELLKRQLDPKLDDESVQAVTDAICERIERESRRSNETAG